MRWAGSMFLSYVGRRICASNTAGWFLCGVFVRATQLWVGGFVRGWFWPSSNTAVGRRSSAHTTAFERRKPSSRRQYARSV